MTDDHWSDLVESYHGMKNYYILKFILPFNFQGLYMKHPCWLYLGQNMTLNLPLRYM